MSDSNKHWSETYWIVISLMMAGCVPPTGVLDDGGNSAGQTSTAQSGSHGGESDGGDSDDEVACTAGPAYSFNGGFSASVTGQYVVDVIQPYTPAQAITVASIGVELATYASSITLDLYSGGTIAAPTSGTVIATSAVNLAGNELGMPQTYTFTLGAVPLQAGQTYWIKVRFPTNNQSGTNAFWFGEVPLGQGGLRWTLPAFSFGWMLISDSTGDEDDSLSFTVTGC